MSTSEIQIERRVLREQIKSYLSDAILRGEFKPGERLVETRIAQQLGVSQAPVREAIRDLEVLGFLKSEPFRGASVRQLSVEELTEIYPVRAALEGVAAREAAKKLTEEQFAHLEELLEKMLDASANTDQRSHTEYDVAFHRVIMQASGNRSLIHIWNTLQLSTWTAITAARSGRNLGELAERHRVVLEALRTRDPLAAEQAMRNHIEELGEWVRNQAEKNSQAAKQNSSH
jgi:DNA-binding GntR family transcriptional regulator